MCLKIRCDGEYEKILQNFLGTKQGLNLSVKLKRLYCRQHEEERFQSQVLGSAPKRTVSNLYKSQGLCQKVSFLLKRKENVPSNYMGLKQNKTKQKNSF